MIIAVPKWRSPKYEKKIEPRTTKYILISRHFFAFSYYSYQKESVDRKVRVNVTFKKTPALLQQKYRRRFIYFSLSVSCSWRVSGVEKERNKNEQGGPLNLLCHYGENLALD